MVCFSCSRQPLSTPTSTQCHSNCDLVWKLVLYDCLSDDTCSNRTGNLGLKKPQKQLALHYTYWQTSCFSQAHSSIPGSGHSNSLEPHFNVTRVTWGSWRAQKAYICFNLSHTVRMYGESMEGILHFGFHWRVPWHIFLHTFFISKLLSNWI